MTGKIYEIGCLHPSCPFSVSLHDSIKLAECVTSDVRLAHNHPLVVGNGPSAKELEKAEGKVMAAAKTELARLRAPAGYREGIEKEEAEDVLWPSCEQECVLWDLRDVWGEERAREWERAFREEGLLASDYPVRQHPSRRSIRGSLTRTPAEPLDLRRSAPSHRPSRKASPRMRRQASCQGRLRVAEAWRGSPAAQEEAGRAEEDVPQAVVVGGRGGHAGQGRQEACRPRHASDGPAFPPVDQELGPQGV